MKLSLSVRIAELENRKDHAFMPIEQLAPLAREVGFQGLSMRASVVSVDSPPERVAEVRRILDETGLAVSMVRQSRLHQGRPRHRRRGSARR